MRFSIALFAAVSLAVAAPGPIRFKVVLDAWASRNPVSGRLFVLMTNQEDRVERITTSFVPEGNWISAMEVEAIRPGEAVLFDPDAKAYPRPFSAANTGRHQFMALLDRDHSYPYTGQNEGDVFGPVVQVEIDPANTEPIELHLSTIMAACVAGDLSPQVRPIEMQSKLLSAFWGRPILMRAALVLPPGYDTDTASSYPAVYNIHAFGATSAIAARMGPGEVREMKDGKRPEMVSVYLDGSFPSGHHAFADSVNNGPWSQALIEEFIPYLESKYRLIAKPHARFLTGHSSGGWSSLWLQVNYPDFFGGTWSTSPDSVTFRSFTGIDASAGSKDNAFRRADGAARNLVRMKGRNVASMEEFIRQEEVAGPVGGQFSSFEWVFSPRGADGRPMKLFNRVTGEQDPLVQKYWERYDIRLQVERNWAALGPKLLGKIHLVAGNEDTFHLEEAVKLFCGFLESKGRGDACEIVPGRDHMDLYRRYDTYPDGLELRIAQEMREAFERAGSKKGKRK